MSEINIPEGWESIELGKVCDVVMGQSPNGLSINQSNIGFPFLQGNAEFQDKYPLEKNWTTYPTRIAKKNSILLSVRAPVGDLNIADKNYCIGRGISSIYTSSIYIEYLFFYMTHNKIQFSSLSQGSTFGSINRQDIEKFIILFPKSREEQQKIAQILSEVDNAITKTKELIAKNQRLKTALMQDLLSYGIDENGKIRDPKTHKFKPSPLGDIPVEWECIELGKLLDYEQPTKYLVSTTNYNNAYQIPVLTAGKTFILGYTNEQYGIFDKKLPVIIFDDFTTASKYVDFPFKVKSSAMKILIIKDKTININLIYELMQRLNFKPEEHKRHWISIYSKLKIILPKSKTEQQKIANILSSQDDKITKLKDKLTKLEHLKASLMQDLLSGRVRVTKLLEKE